MLFFIYTICSVVQSYCINAIATVGCGKSKHNV